MRLFSFTRSGTRASCFGGHGLFFRGKWVLLDGDKIAALCAAFIHEELAKLGLDKVPCFSIPSCMHATNPAANPLRDSLQY